MSLISPYFQLISLPSCNDRGAVTYNFGLSAEEGGPNKQGRTDFLSSTNRWVERPELPEQSPHGDRGYQPFSMSQLCFPKWNWFSLIVV